MEKRSAAVQLDWRGRHDPDGALRVALLGDIDIGVAEELLSRLRQLRRSRTRTRLDLSQLRFVDFSGLRVILRALSEARRVGWELEVDRRVSPNAQRIIDYAGVAAVIWPGEPRSAGVPVRTARAGDPRRP